MAEMLGDYAWLADVISTSKYETEEPPIMVCLGICSLKGAVQRASLGSRET